MVVSRIRVNKASCSRVEYLVITLTRFTTKRVYRVLDPLDNDIDVEVELCGFIEVFHCRAYRNHTSIWHFSLG